jgi:transcriptional regulator with XRE-family HTH domain
MFFKQFKRLCEEHNTSPNGVAKILNISSGSVTAWKRDGSVPYAKTLQKIADYFGVTTDYLLGNEQKKEPVTERDKLVEETNELFNKLPLDKKKQALEYLRFLVEHQGKQ